MNKKLISIIVGVLVVSIGAFFFLRGGSEPTVVPNSVQQPKGVLKLEGDPWSGYITARDPGFANALKAQGYNYSYGEQLDQSVRARNLTEGHTDFMATTLGQFLKKRPAGKVVAMIDESTGADALVLNTVDHPYLKSIDQIQKLVREFKAKGKKPVLAYTGDSPSEELLLELSNTYDELKLSDFELVPVAQSADAYKMLANHEAQLAIVWEPDTSAARAAGHTVALSSKNAPRRILDVIVASDRIIANDPQAVQAVVTEFYRARKYNAAHPAEFQAAIAKDGNLNAEDAKTVLDGIYLFDAASAHTFFSTPAYPLDQTPMWESVQGIAGIIALTDPSVKPNEKMWDGRFAKKAAELLK